MLINWKEIVFSPYTRGIARQVNEKLLEGVEVEGSTTSQEMKIPAVNADRSAQLLVMLMTGLSSDEVDAITVSEYDEVKKSIDEMIQGKKK